MKFIFYSNVQNIYRAGRQKTSEIIKTKANIDVSINENKIENLKLLFDSTLYYPSFFEHRRPKGWGGGGLPHTEKYPKFPPFFHQNEPSTWK